MLRNVSFWAYSADLPGCYDWQGRSGIAGRLCPNDQAGPRPEAVISASLRGLDRRSIRFGLTAT